jgi:hypothetical protein
MKHQTAVALSLILLLVFFCGCLDEPPAFPPYDETKNYCGPEGLFSGPNSNPLSGASFNPACYEHDKCYAECKTNGKNQAQCDNEFKQTMDGACDDVFDKTMNECDKKAGYNPFKYTCIIKARLATSSCWTQSGTYYGLVSAGGKAVGAYPCED